MGASSAQRKTHHRDGRGATSHLMKERRRGCGGRVGGRGVCVRRSAMPLARESERECARAAAAAAAAAVRTCRGAHGRKERHERERVRRHIIQPLAGGKHHAARAPRPTPSPSLALVPPQPMCRNGGRRETAGASTRVHASGRGGGGSMIWCIWSFIHAFTYLSTSIHTFKRQK